MPGDLTGSDGYADKTQHQLELDERNRRHTLLRLLTYARQTGMGTVELVKLVEELGLEDELELVVAEDPKRHRRITAARRLLSYRLHLEGPLEYT